MDENTKIRLLSAPKLPMTINQGEEMNSWYDLRSFNAKPDSYNINDAIYAQKTLNDIVEEEIEKVGGNSEKVFIGGYCQGAALALHVGLGYKKPLGGVCVLSGFKFRETTTHENSKNVPVFVAHGVVDLAISLGNAYETYLHNDWVKQPNVQFYPIEDAGHVISPMALEQMRSWVELLALEKMGYVDDKVPNTTSLEE